MLGTIVNHTHKSASNQRNSNLELFRIVVMLLIIAHHYVVSSGLTSADGPMYLYPMNAKTIFLYLFGAWGKTGINCFVLISGYFMCTSQITAKKFIKLLLEVLFYNIVIYAVFLVFGYSHFTFNSLLKALIPITTVGHDFISCYLLFFLLIPFLNITIRSMNEKQHILLVMLLSFIYIFLGTVFGTNVMMNYVTWFSVLYFIAAYVKLYPRTIFSNAKVWGILMGILIFASAICIVGFHFLSQRSKLVSAFSLMTDSNKIFAFAVAFCSFMFFKNIKIRQNKFINTIAASTLGVLLIHANSDTMRNFLWKDLLSCVDAYQSKWLIIHAIASVVGIYAVCTVIDYLRIRFLEVPFFHLWDKHWEKVHEVYCRGEKYICNKLGIESKDE